MIMGKIKKILLCALVTTCIACFSMMFACSNKDANYTIETATPVAQKTIFSAGTSIDLFSLFETGDGFTYKFTVTNKSTNERTEVSGRSFYAKTSGEYEVLAEGVKANVKRIGTAVFTVSDTLPFMLIKSGEINMNYKSSIDLNMLLANINMFIVSATDVKYSVDQVEYVKNPYQTESQILDLNDPNGFLDGNGKVHFDKEGIYKFHLLATNQGGTVSGNFTINVKESTSSYVELGSVNFDYETHIASWEAVDNASYYRVKVDYENVITADTQIDISEHLVEEANGFQYFDLVVIPLDENKNEIKFEDSEGYEVNGMKIYRELLLAPSQYGQIVLGKYSKVNPDTGVVTMEGAKATSSLGRDGIHNMDNGYFAWKGEYGLNTFIDFEFKGNNFPNVCFFADKINGDLTYGNKMDDSEKNKGLVIISGIYGAYQTGAYMLAAGDTIGMYGPHRFESGWSNPNNRWCPLKIENNVQYNAPVYLSNGWLEPSPYKLLTQTGLINDDTDRTYKVVMGTVGEKGKLGTKIFLDVKLYDVNNLEKPIYSIITDTKLYTKDFVEEGETFKGGNIIVYAPSKGETAISQFKISKPYYVEPTDSGSYTLNGAYPGNVNYLNFKSENGDKWNSGYKAFSGAGDNGYGLNTYVDINFTGNNLPVITLLASESASGIAEGCKSGFNGSGILLLNGIVNENNKEEPKTKEQYTDRFRVYGPYKYGAVDLDGNKVYDQNTQTNCIWATQENSIYPNLYKLGQDYLLDGVDYRLIVGIIEKKGNIYLDISFINRTENTLVFSYNVDTKVSVSQMKEIMGIESGEELKGYIILNGAYKGLDNDGNYLDTNFTVDFKNAKIPLPENITIIEDVEDGDYNLNGAYPGNVNYVNFKSATGTLWNSGCAVFDGTNDYGYKLGTYLDLTFTGNNLPIITLFASEKSVGIAEGCEQGVTGAGILLLNGIVNGTGNEYYTDRFRIYGPYKYGAKDDDGNKIYDQLTSTNCVAFTKLNETYPKLYRLGQEHLLDGVNYRLIIGAIEKNGNIHLDMQFINATDNTLIFDYIVDTNVSVSQMKDLLEINQSEELAGYVLMNGAYKGKDVDNNYLGTNFNVQFRKEKISLPQGITNEIVLEGGEYTLSGAYPGNVNYVNFVASNGDSWVTESEFFDGSDNTGYGLNTYLDITFSGNNLPMITFFASEKSAGIGEGAKTDVTGAGILLLNGIVNGSGAENYTNLFRIYGPYKYGAKNSQGEMIYDQHSSTNSLWVNSSNTTYPNLYNLGQDYLLDGVDYRLIVGVIEQDGQICLDMQFINVTESQVIFSQIVDTKVSVSDMRNILGISESEQLKGIITVSGAYKGKDASNNYLPTTFSVTIHNEKIETNN